MFKELCSSFFGFDLLRAGYLEEYLRDKQIQLFRIPKNVEFNYDCRKQICFFDRGVLAIHMT